MGLAFFETMRGHVVDRWGASHRFDFEVKAEADRTRRLLRTGQARLTGVVKAPPWVDEGPAEGLLTIRTDALIYDLTFGEYRFQGHKDLSSWRNLLKAMTLLRGELTRDGEVLGRGELWFVMDDLANFLTSWGPSYGIKRLPAPPTDPDRALIESFARALIPPGERVPGVDAETVDRTLEIVRAMPQPLADGMGTALRLLDGAALARHGRTFARLTEAQARGVVESIGDTRALHLLSTPVKTAHFHRRDYLDAVGAPTYAEPIRREAEPRWTERITAVEDLPADSELECEVVIIGTGAGGAAAAATLAEAGVATLMIEAGRHVRRDAFRGDPIERMKHLYRDAGMTFTVGNPPISVPLGQVVGGTTLVNSGTAFRTPDDVVGEWRSELGFGDDFDLSGPLDAVCDELGVGPNEPRYLGRIAKVVADGAEAMGLPHGPLPRNAPGCDGQGTCVFGCPTDAKRSTNVSYVPRALQAGAELLTGLRVTRLLTWNRRIVGVEARGTDRSGAAKVVRVRCQAVIVSCGSLITPNFLRDNGLRGDWIGKNLSVHPGFGIQGLFDEPMEPWSAVPQGYGVYGLDQHGVKLEGYWMPPGLAMTRTPLVGSELTRWMDAWDRVGSFGFMTRDRGRGTVLRGPGGRPIIRYDLDPDGVRMLAKGTAVLAEVMLRGGATEVLVGTGPVKFVRTVAEARAIETARFKPMDFDLLGAHPLGTCRVASTPALGACDLDHRVWETDNLYVMDGSSVPTSLGVNPQVTIMAMAVRASRRLADRLS